MLCFSRGVLVRVFICMTYLSVGMGPQTYKLLNFVVQVLVQGVCLFVCVYVSTTYLSVGMGPQT